MAEPVSMALHVVNMILTLGLLYIYGQNYRKMRSKYTIGLMLFAFVFLVHSALGLYFDTSMVMYSSVQAETAAMILEVIKAISFAVLLWISWE